MARHGRRALAAAGLVAAFAAPRPSKAGEVVHDFLVSPRLFLERPATIDPDEPALKLEYVGRLRAMLGAAVGLYGLEADELGMAVGPAAFVELVNLGNASPVPWETFRAHVGLCTWWSLDFADPALPAGGRLLAELGYFHESDHAASAQQLRHELLHESSADPLVRYAVNGYSLTLDELMGNLSSYEYVKLKLTAVQPLGADVEVIGAFGLRLFPPAVSPVGLRQLEYGLSGELGVDVRASEATTVYGALYWEGLANSFDSTGTPYRLPFHGDTLQYLVANAGVRIDDGDGLGLSLYGAYSYSHGRGLDFVEHYGHELGGGAAFHLF